MTICDILFEQDYFNPDSTKRNIKEKVIEGYQKTPMARMIFENLTIIQMFRDLVQLVTITQYDENK